MGYQAGLNPHLRLFTDLPKRICREQHALVTTVSVSAKGVTSFFMTAKWLFKKPQPLNNKTVEMWFGNYRMLVKAINDGDKVLAEKAYRTFLYPIRMQKDLL